MNAVLSKLQRVCGNRLKENEPLARYTTLKVGGPADFFYEAKTIEELVSVYKEARTLGIPIFILGGGTNLLIGDKGIRGLVIKNSTSKIALRGAKGRRTGNKSLDLIYIEVDSGVPMNQLVRFTIEEGFGGLEMHLGLPGTVGGAIYMNSKWTHPMHAVGDVVYQATIMDTKGSVSVVPQNYFRFGYDTSSIQKTRDCVLQVVFALTAKSKEELWKIANESIAHRRGSQPQGVSTAGCTFKNISPSQAITIPTPNHTTSAGFLLDHTGLKGLHVGDAEISSIHANFIVNKGKATARDVVELIDMAKRQIQDKFGVSLQEEIIRVGDF